MRGGRKLQGVKVYKPSGSGEAFRRGFAGP